MNYCKKIDEFIKQDVLCLICGQCELNMKEINDQNKRIMKCLDLLENKLDNPNKLNDALMFKNCQLGKEFENENE